ncbi:hypothetical protein JT305_24345 [Salmonella enterica subsp. enterica serovar Senftenberg]|nr:hypothetical protein [Salmonella enterica subsp. enterica serovar Senftenberg]
MVVRVMAACSRASGINRLKIYLDKSNDGVPRASEINRMIVFFATSHKCVPRASEINRRYL